MYLVKKTIWRGLVVLIMLFMTAGPAAAGVLPVSPLTLVSGPSPFAGCTIGSLNNDSINYVNSEVEPRMAINPANPNNIIGVYQQDRWSDGGAHGLVTAVTHNGGTTWSRTCLRRSIASNRPTI